MHVGFWRVFGSHVTGSYAVAIVVLILLAYKGYFVPGYLCAATAAPVLFPLVCILTLTLILSADTVPATPVVVFAIVYVSTATAGYYFIGRRDRLPTARYYNRQCTRCGYDLRAASSHYCPECGEKVPLRTLNAARPLTPPPIPPPTTSLRNTP